MRRSLRNSEILEARFRPGRIVVVTSPLGTRSATVVGVDWDDERGTYVVEAENEAGDSFAIPVDEVAGVFTAPRVNSRPPRFREGMRDDR